MLSSIGVDCLRDTSFFAPQKPLAMTIKVQYGPLIEPRRGFFNNGHILKRYVLELLCRSSRVLRCCNEKLASQRLSTPMLSSPPLSLSPFYCFVYHPFLPRTLGQEFVRYLNRRPSPFRSGKTTTTATLPNEVGKCSATLAFFGPNGDVSDLSHSDFPSPLLFSPNLHPFWGAAASFWGL